MDVVNKQREEQSQALLWQPPIEPEIHIPKTLHFPTASSEALESETSVSKSSAASKQDDRLSKRSGGKKNILNGESTAAEDSAADDCSPVVVLKRLVKDLEDPNKRNFGLLYVDIDVSSKSH